MGHFKPKLFYFNMKVYPIVLLVLVAYAVASPLGEADSDMADDISAYHGTVDILAKDTVAYSDRTSFNQACKTRCMHDCSENYGENAMVACIGMCTARHC